MIDARMVNEKLVDRGCRFVSEIAKISYNDAQKYILAADKKVKTACVMAIKKTDKNTAEKLLAENGGILRKIID